MAAIRAGTGGAVMPGTPGLASGGVQCPLPTCQLLQKRSCHPRGHETGTSRCGCEGGNAEGLPRVLRVLPFYRDFGAPHPVPVCQGQVAPSRGFSRDGPARGRVTPGSQPGGPGQAAQGGTRRLPSSARSSLPLDYGFLWSWGQEKQSLVLPGDAPTL